MILDTTILVETFCKHDNSNEARGKFGYLANCPNFNYDIYTQKISMFLFKLLHWVTACFLSTIRLWEMKYVKCHLWNVMMNPYFVCTMFESHLFSFYFPRPTFLEKKNVVKKKIIAKWWQSKVHEVIVGAQDIIKSSLLS